MTDFQQELSEPAAIEQGFWESTRYPSYLQSSATGGAQRQPAAALIAAVTELADVIARKRAPRMDGLRVRLQRSDGSRELGDLEVALRGLHRAAAELDVLAAREGESAAARLQDQCQVVRDAANRLWTTGAAVLARHTVDTPVARLLWIELMLESQAIEARVHQGREWLAGVEADLQARRAAAPPPVIQRALQQLERRGQGLHQRLQRLAALGASARSVHDECERLVGHRETLCRTLRDQVGPATTRLQESIVPLAAVRAAQASRELVAVVDARHALQVALTQAAAEVQRLQLCEHEAALQLIALGQGTLRLG